MNIYEKYNVHTERGFLPSSDPILSLSYDFVEWEELAKNFTAYINAGVIREKIDTLSIPDISKLKGDRELERSMMLLSFFAHAYVHLPPTSTTFLPACIAQPWVAIANKLQRNPIISHASIVLENWRKLDPAKPISLDNLTTLIQFHGGLDESWFYLVTTEIEAIGAGAIPHFLDAMMHANKGGYNQAGHSLKTALPILTKLTSTLQRMYEQCDPHIFYLRIRPFLASFDNIEYRGTEKGHMSFHGGSAAQSSLLQFFDAALGIKYENKAAQSYLTLMRKHMPYKHAEFLSWTEDVSKIKEACAKSSELQEAYRQCASALLDFRNEHLKMVALYVMQQAKKQNKEAVGTGGTSPMHFLKSVRNQNKELI